MNINFNFSSIKFNFFKKSKKVKEKSFKPFIVKKIKEPKKILSLHQSHFLLILVPEWIIKFDSNTLQHYNKSFIEVYTEYYYIYNKEISKLKKNNKDFSTKYFNINGEEYKIIFNLLKYDNQVYACDIEKIKYSNINLI